VIGISATLVMSLLTIFRDLIPIFGTETWVMLTTEGYQAYSPFWAPLIIFEFAGNAVTVIFASILLKKMFEYKKNVPMMAIGFITWIFVYSMIDSFGIYSIPVLSEKAYQMTSGPLSKSILACLIWIPYFLKSERVRNTFIE
ncbi:DUF2569 domain-containing protein, partial [bacterium]|nr:DUF2569 domain-containing protein [bacterium]